MGCNKPFRKGRFPIKGKGGAGLPILYKYTYPKNAGVILTQLGVDDGKQEVMSRLSITDGDGRMIFPNDDKFFGRRGYDENYFKQLLAEKRVVRKSGGLVHVTWEPVYSHVRNESLDLAVYNFACALSCAGNNPEAFWRQRYELLHDLPVKPKRRKPVKKCVEGELYDQT